MACNLTEDQSKEFLKDPTVRAGVMDVAVDKYFKSGADIQETINGIANETGLHKAAIKELLDGQAGNRKLTDEMWARQYVKRQIGLQNKRLADSVGSSGFTKAYRAYDNVTRQMATYGHFTVFGKTHGGDNLFTNPGEYLKNFKNSLRLPTEAGQAAHERAMVGMFDDELYKPLIRSGLDVTPRSEVTSILGGGKSKLSHGAFEELQLRRFEAAKKAVTSLLTPEERTVENMKPIAEVVNNRWGGGQPGRLGSLFGKILFGPRLTPAQWRTAFMDNAKMVYNGVFNRANATPGELAAARMTAARMGKLLALYGGVMGLEAAAAQAGVIDKRNMPNITNPKDTGTFGRIKIFGKGIPLSPTIELLTLPIKMLYSAYASKPGENHLVNFISPLAKYVGYRLSPGLSLAASMGLGQEVFSGRPMPWHETQLTKKGLPVMSELTKPKLTYTEFLGERMPIPVAVFMRDVYDEMRSDGVDHPTAKHLISSGIAAATTGIAGYEWHPDINNAYKLAEQRTPEGASDQQRQKILSAAMKEFRSGRAHQPSPKEAFGIGQ